MCWPSRKRYGPRYEECASMCSVLSGPIEARYALVRQALSLARMVIDKLLYNYRSHRVHLRGRHLASLDLSI